MSEYFQVQIMLPVPFLGQRLFSQDEYFIHMVAGTHLLDKNFFHALATPLLRIMNRPYIRQDPMRSIFFEYPSV